MKKLTLYAALALGMSSSFSNAASFQGLGDLPGASFFSYALGVSDGGNVVTGVGTSSSGEEAFRWTPEGGMVGLGNSLAGGFMVHATKVSRNGSVIGGYGNSASGIKAVRWEGGVGAFITEISGGGQSDVRAVSADGLALAGYIYSANGVEAYRWTSVGGMQLLGDLPGGAFLSDAYAISDGGTVVVGSGSSSEGGVPFRWENGVMETLLGFPSGGFRGAALAVTPDGSVIAGFDYHPSVGAEAFRWTQSGGFLGLGDLPGGAFQSQAFGISGNGALIVGQGTTPNGDEAFIWDATLGLRNLKAVLVSDHGLSTELNGWLLISAVAISPDGTAIAGYGRNPSGQIEAWMASLATPCNDLPVRQWDKVLGGPGNDLLLDVRSTADGGLIAAGYSDSPVGPGKAAAYGDYDYWVMKLDANANVQWERTFGGDNFEYLQTALPLRNGGYFLVGYSASGATGNKTIPSFGGTDIWIIRLDNDGNRLWERVYGGSDNDQSGGQSAVIETSDGGILIAGTSVSLANTGNKTSPRHSIGYDFWLLKLDSNGLKQWEQTYYDGGTVGGGSFVHEAPDAYFVAGFTGFGDFTAWSGRVNKATGALLTQNNYGSSVVLETGLPLPDGGYWLAGWTYVANSSFWLRRVDAFGNHVTARQIGGGDIDRAHSLLATRDGGFLAGGESFSPPGGDRTAQNYGSDDYWLVKLDDQGNVVWDQAYGGTGYEYLSKVIETPDGSILLGGYSNSDALLAGGKSLGNLGGLDWWIIKLRSPCVSDTEPPMIICPADLTANADAGACEVVVNFTVAATDNSGVTSVVCDPPSGTIFPKGITTVHCTATDAAGNAANCNFTVTVTDPTLPPSIVAISIPPNSQTSESRPAYDQVWDVTAPPYPFAVNSGIGVIVNPVIVGGNNNHDFALHRDDNSPNDGNYVPNRESSTVTYRFDQPVVVSGVEIVQHVFGITKVEGFSGNSLSAMTSLGAVFGPSGDVMNGFVVPSEAQSQVFSFNNTSMAGNYFQLVVRKIAHPTAYANYRIFPLDQNGHRIPTATECGQNTPPTISCPADVTFTCAPAAGLAVSVSATASDSDSGQTLTVTLKQGAMVLDTQTVSTPANSALVTFNAVPLLPGSHPLTIEVSDGTASASCNTTVTVEPDTTPPAAPVLASVTGQCSVTVPAPTAPDDCGGTVTGTTSDSLVYSSQGTFIVHWTFNDGNGNISTANQTVIVQDTAAPVITGCPADITVQTGPGRNTCDQVATWTAPTASDNCQLTSFSSDHNSGDIFPIGTTVVTYTAADGATPPNAATCSFTVTVMDNTAPVIICPANITLPCSVNLSEPVSFAATATDNCSPSPTITYSRAPGSGFPVGVTTVTCAATDAAGNSSQCSFTVTRAALEFTGFNSPIGGEVATGMGGSFSDPVRAFKFNSKIPVSFQVSCGGTPVTTGTHTLQLAKYSNATDSSPAIDATPAGAATEGNQFRLTDATTGRWAFTLDTKPLSVGTWKLSATLSDGTVHSVWITIKN